ncbi:hypothetical protein P344_04550 [Spiroplasma mirum ATCC 29335]|uniref:Uncharacterized protein n=1 Tax=Spiroplasma mirum ATCC 29335 TaxID=838561 RepID=W0GRA9_9MOLU|nr:MULTISPECIES: hypothetical protein [Spiroplasma]AHF61164.1 hypothetical protein SMM_0757 [Spiroplasma mirum ATCC 29335]AHI58232.1 hypothetical protein P344_04550 [Spiroplasma mirum ATCC 29335]AKM53264.1 hypothetical protein SATRI_v1c08240 [Spiroplasma atrichopogonis]
MKWWIPKKWYKDYIWYYKVIISGIAFGFLAYGFYMNCFKEFWYVNPRFEPWTTDYSLKNYDVLLSFYSVQVNIITIVWLILIIFNHHREQKLWFFSTNFKLSILNWNILMFIIFWIKIITGYKNGQLIISDYTTAQVTCTVVTHFVMPILFFVYTFLTFGDYKIHWVKNFVKKDWWVAISYPLFYFFSVVVRGAIWTKDGNTAWAYPYPFLDLNFPMVENASKVEYSMLIIVGFFVIFSMVQILLNLLNNAMFKVFEKYQDKTLWYERIWVKFKNWIKTKTNKRKDYQKE